MVMAQSCAHDCKVQCRLCKSGPVNRIIDWNVPMGVVKVHSGHFLDSSNDEGDDYEEESLRKRIGPAQPGDILSVRVEGYYHNDRQNNRILFEDCQHTFVVGSSDGVVPEGLAQAVAQHMAFGEQEAMFTLTSDVAYGDRPYTGSNGIVAPASSDVVMILSWNRLERNGTHYSATAQTGKLGLFLCCC